MKSIHSGPSNTIWRACGQPSKHDEDFHELPFSPCEEQTAQDGHEDRGERL